MNQHWLTTSCKYFFPDFKDMRAISEGTLSTILSFQVKYFKNEQSEILSGSRLFLTKVSCKEFYNE